MLFLYKNSLSKEGIIYLFIKTAEVKLRSRRMEKIMEDVIINEF